MKINHQQFMRRSYTVDAVQFTVGEAIEAAFKQNPGTGMKFSAHGRSWPVHLASADNRLFLVLLDNERREQHVGLGDWIVKTHDGELYPLRDRYFRDAFVSVPTPEPEPVTEHDVMEAKQQMFLGAVATVAVGLYIAAITLGWL